MNKKWAPSVCKEVGVDGYTLLPDSNQIHVSQISEVHGHKAKVHRSAGKWTASGSWVLQDDGWREHGSADRWKIGCRPCSPRIIVEAKCFKLNHAKIREIDSTMVVVFY